MRRPFLPPSDSPRAHADPSSFFVSSRSTLPTTYHFCHLYSRYPCLRWLLHQLCVLAQLRLFLLSFTFRSWPDLPSSLNKPQSPLPPLHLYSSTPQSFNPPSLDLHLQGLLALLLSLKKKPIIRWERMSGTAKKLASEVGYAMQPQSAGSYGDLFNFRGVSGAQPLLLILGELENRARRWSFVSQSRALISFGFADVQIAETILLHLYSRNGRIRRWCTS